MKLIQIDNTILVQKPQSVIISTRYFLLYVGCFAALLFAIYASSLLSAICCFILSAFFALRWFSGSSFYTLKFPKKVEKKIFKIPLKDGSYIIFFGSSLEEAQLFATLNEISIDGIELISENGYSFT